MLGRLDGLVGDRHGVYLTATEYTCLLAHRIFCSCSLARHSIGGSSDSSSSSGGGTRKLSGVGIARASFPSGTPSSLHPAEMHRNTAAAGTPGTPGASSDHRATSSRAYGRPSRMAFIAMARRPSVTKPASLPPLAHSASFHVPTGPTSALLQLSPPGAAPGSQLHPLLDQHLDAVERLNNPTSQPGNRSGSRLSIQSITCYDQ